MVIRPETSSDHEAVRRVVHEAFARHTEARLVELLRAEDSIIASIVAVDDVAGIVGHILFTPATIITTSNEYRVASLAPMAVVPRFQRQGIGSLLVERGLQECKQAGYRAAIVVGHPSYYPRFGFCAATVASLANPFSRGDAFMGAELARGSLSDLGEGRVVYPSAFDRIT